MNIKELVDKSEDELKLIFNKVDNICFINSKKVLDSFKKNKLSEIHLNGTTGYGYGDIGRDVIEKIYSDIFKSEDALVRSQFISGSHALTVCLFGILRPNDLLLSITGTPYDTLHEVIGIKDNDSSLKSFGIKYDEIELKNDDFNYDEIKKYITNNKVKMIEIQRSKGYSTRKSISITKIEKVIKFIKELDENIIIMVDNCYCEFVCEKEPIEVGADLVVGSLIKNMGGGMCPNGGYIVGKSKLIKLCAERLNLPGEGKDVGPSINNNKNILLGLFMAPQVVKNALKVSILTSKVLESLGYLVEPKYNEERVDIVQNIIFNDEEKLIKFCEGIQKSSPIDSFVTPYPSDMPGYEDKVIMAAGTFVQGSSIELSCDGPIRKPYIAYMQGSLSYEYGKLSLIDAIEYLKY